MTHVVAELKAGVWQRGHQNLAFQLILIKDFQTVFVFGMSQLRGQILCQGRNRVIVVESKQF